MTDEYLLFSIRLGAWQTNGGVYTSDTKQARRVTRAIAISLCRNQLGAGGHELGLVPVALNLIEEIRK